MSDRRVGIIVNSKQDIFSSGMVQNAYFIKLCLETLGFMCDFLSFDENPPPFKYKSIPVKRIDFKNSVFDIKNYHTLITVAFGLGKTEHDICKENKTAVVSFICGNHFMHDIENFVRGNDNGRLSFVGSATHSDELWVIPCYKYALTYLETIRKRPAFIVPHLWSPIIIEEMTALANKPKDKLYYMMPRANPSKITLLIAEPNVALFKGSWMPVCAGEYLHQKNAELIDEVYAFSWPDNSHSYTMSNSLSLGKKLRRFKRLTMPDIMTHFNTLSSMPIFVSHQINNSLNYLYYECLYYGWPLVHNSVDLEGCGYYYKENDIEACANAILYAQKHHIKNIESYKAKAREYLRRVDPFDPDVQSTWRQYMNSVKRA
jgi:hypothetical protein